jgi:hypothetical protein
MAEGANSANGRATSEGAKGAKADEGLLRYLDPAAIPWSDFELYLSYTDGHDLNLPDDPAELAELADAIRAINWLAPGPAGLEP